MAASTATEAESEASEGSSVAPELTDTVSGSAATTLGVGSAGRASATAPSAGGIVSMIGFGDADDGVALDGRVSGEGVDERESSRAILQIKSVY